MNPLSLTDGRVVVPGNRWDLVPRYPARPPTVAVVIPYYNQQRQLDLVLKALDLQTFPRHLVTVVVADDGSAEPPVLPPTDLTTSVVRQEDRGFRAAAARNLGAAATDAAVLCFLDADTVPEPTYLHEITRLPAQLPDALVVARRRHADLGAVPPSQLARWWSGDAVPEELPEPEWLTDAYAASGDLLHVDHRSYRYVISSVMCCSADLFDDIGGFDESFGQYGGEDWELAHRAVANGAVLHHCRDAVAWHDGPDWGDRPVQERTAAKNAEALALSRSITDPDARRSGLRYAVPDLVVRIETAGHTTASLIHTVSCFLGQDVGIWVAGDGATDLLDAIGAADPRVQVGPAPPEVLRRCRFVIDTAGRPVLPTDGVSAVLGRCAAGGVGAVAVSTGGASVVCRASWAVNRVRRWTTGAVRFADPADADRVSEAVILPAESVGLRSGEPQPDLSW